MARKHVPDQVIKELEATEAIWCRWLNQYGSGKNAEASTWSRDLDEENARVKQLLAEKELARDILHEVARGKFRPPNRAAAPARTRANRNGWRPSTPCM